MSHNLSIVPIKNLKKSFLKDLSILAMEIMEENKSLVGNKFPKELSRLYLFLTFVIQMDLIVSLKVQWQDYMKRILSLKEFNTTLFALFGFLSMSFEVECLDRYIELHLKNKNKMSSRGNKILSARDFEKKEFERITPYVFMAIFLSGSVLPYFQGILLAMKHGTENMDFEKLPYIIYTHYPKSMRTVPIYLTILSVQFVWYGLMLIQWYHLYKSFFVSTLCLITEMKILMQAITDFDCELVESREKMMEDDDRPKNTEEKSLQLFMSQIITKHSEICSGLKTLNSGLKIMIPAFFNILALQMCLYILFVIEMNEVVARVKYSVTGVVVASINISASKIGQRVLDEGEKLRLAMCQSKWTDKPVWLQKCMLLMITRATRSMWLNSYGLYVVDMSSITNIMKGTYTYFNLVQNCKV